MRNAGVEVDSILSKLVAFCALDHWNSDIRDWVCRVRNKVLSRAEIVVLAKPDVRLLKDVTVLTAPKKMGRVMITNRAKKTTRMTNGLLPVYPEKRQMFFSI
jgi:hypothetical protein